MQECDVSTLRVRELAQNALMREDFARYFMNVIDTLSKSVSLKQILNMNEPGVTARSFKGKE
jgi:hypothetical protein